MSIENLELQLILKNLDSVINTNTFVSEAEFDLFIAQILQMRAKKVSGEVYPNQETIKTFELTDKNEDVSKIDNLDDFFTEINISANHA